MLNDLRFSFRQIIKTPGFAAITILTLAVGIGANTAIFSLMNVVLLKPLPYTDSQRLVRSHMSSDDSQRIWTSGGIYLDWLENADSFEDLAATHDSVINMTNTDEPKRLIGLEVTANYLKMLGINSEIGRGFRALDDEPGGNNDVIILTNRFWKSEFGGDPDVIGKMIAQKYWAREIIGVLPPNSLIRSDLDYLIPAVIRGEDWKNSRDHEYVTDIYGKLKPGISIQTANTELTSILNSLRHLYPDKMQDWVSFTESLQEATFGNYKPYVLTLFTAVGMLLLVSCANVANLLLAKGIARQGEIAIRAAIGASGWQIARQLLCESLILSLMGGLIGLCIGWASLKPLSLLVQLDPMTSSSLEIDSTVLVFTLLISLLTGLLFGGLPAINAVRMNMASRMRVASRSATGAGQQHLQASLIVVEVALTFALLVSIGLLLKSFANAFEADPGFNPDRVLAFDMSKNGDIPERMQFTEQFLDRMQQIPGVESAGLVSAAPMNGFGNYFGGPIWRDDQPELANGYTTGYNAVYGNYFETMGIPILRGRMIERADQNADAPRVIILNQKAAKDLFEDEDPLGRYVHFEKEKWKVIGIVGNIKRLSLDIPVSPMAYLPQVHFPWFSSYVVKTKFAPQEIISQIKETLKTVDPNQPIDRIRTMESSVSKSVEGRRIMISLLGIFGLMAILLAAVGIYGLTSFLVERRRREIGIRLAIGASSQSIVRMIVKRGLNLSLFGIALGIVGVIGAGRFLAFTLYEVAPYDPIILFAVAILTLTVTAIASWRPARQTSAIHPSTALSAE